MNAIEPVSATTPFQVGLGNHEQDWSGTGTLGLGVILAAIPL